MWATEKSLERAGPHFKSLLVFYLKDRHNVALDIVYDDPMLFHNAVAELFGIYSSKILESVIEDAILDQSDTRVPNTYDDFGLFIKKARNGEIKVAIRSNSQAKDR